MARHVRLALMALLSACVDLTPPAGVSLDDGGDRPDAADARLPDGPAPPDAAADPDAPPPGPDGPPPHDGAGPTDTLLLMNGSACSGGGECQSGVCSQGVCCNRACSGTCWSCKITGTTGTCSPTTGTVCAAGRCTGSTETPPSACDGNGACLAPASRGCGGYLCAGATCGTTCTSGAQCAAGYVCFAGGCVVSGTTPALYWSFDESSGATAFDGSGNGRDGLYTGDVGQPDPVTDVPTLTFTDPRSRVFNLDNRDGVKLTLPAALEPANNLTVTVWYKATRVDTQNSSPGSELVSGGDQYMLRLTPTGPQLVKRTSTTFDKCLGTVTSPLDGRWHHVAGLTTPAGMKVYFDGQERCANALGDPISYTAGSELWVGRHGDGDLDRDFDGQIDDVRIYTRALTAPEIADLAAGGR